jgi:Fe-S cluster assembly iron-binding protein IscA
MLKLTPIAAEAVQQLASAPGMPEEGGVRISPGTPSPTGTPLQLQLAAEPEVDDQTIHDKGATVFVEAHVAEFLDDKVLDAAVEDTGVRFSIVEDDQES